MAERTVKVGIVGFGTIGCGAAKILLEQADSISAKTGLRLELAMVVDVDLDRPRQVELPPGVLTNDLSQLLNDKSIEIAAELVGGTGAAKQIQLQMLAAGKDVVTANKALLAEHGNELYKAVSRQIRWDIDKKKLEGGNHKRPIKSTTKSFFLDIL